jgi:hypothetical protein
MKTTSERKLMRIPEAAQIYGCTRQNLYRFIKEKQLKVYKRYGIKLVDVRDIERLRDEIKPRGIPRKKT